MNRPTILPVRKRVATNSVVPSWACEATSALLIVGLAIGFVVRGRSPTEQVNAIYTQ
ncbi:MAG: hypothetical protein OK449_01025 [Thaumarchaeota archaeon]|nr:hypothetical protein [Nitrososphaerota archaeon]